MNMQYIIINLVLILTMALLSCDATGDNKSDIKCGYNGETIQVIKYQNASIRDLDGRYFLYFVEGLKIDSAYPYLLDTIYLLLPCNLPGQFKVDNQKVLVSGEIKENPGYSSHNNYTDFYINKISNY